MADGDGPVDEKIRNAWRRFCDQLRSAATMCSGTPTPVVDLALETKDPAFPQLHSFCPRHAR